MHSNVQSQDAGCAVVTLSVSSTLVHHISRELVRHIKFSFSIKLLYYAVMGIGLKVRDTRRFDHSHWPLPLIPCCALQGTDVIDYGRYIGVPTEILGVDRPVPSRGRFVLTPFRSRSAGEVVALTVVNPVKRVPWNIRGSIQFERLGKS